MQIEFSDQELGFLKECFTFDLENDKMLSGFARKIMENMIAKIDQTLL